MKTLFIGAALAAFITVPAGAQTTLYSNNFDAPATSAPGVAVGTAAGGGGSVNSGAGAGGLTGNYFLNATPGLTTYTFSGLSGFSNLNLAFTLAFVDSWDSTNGSVTPDYLDIFINGSQVLQLTAANTTGSINTLGGGTQTAFGSFLNNGSFNDRIVDMSTSSALQSLGAPGGTLTLGIRASGGGFQYGSDESWGIDNLRLTGVEVASSAVPEPATWAMLMLGFGAIGSALRRRQTAPASVSFA